MTRTLISCTSPKWVNSFQTKILCVTQFEEISGIHEFLASADDVEDHGRQLYFELASGVYGPIEPYIPPAIDKTETKQGQGGPTIVT